MAITLPLSLAAFADRLDKLDATMSLERYEETSGTAIGQIISRQIALPKWQFECSLASMSFGEAGEIRALIDRLGRSGQFYMFDPWRPYPKNDPLGAVLGSRTVTIHTIGSDNRSLRIAGLPNSYVLSPGDGLSFNRGSDPVRRSFHRVVEAATASAAGLTPLFEVEPHLRVGTVTGTVVTLRKPAAKMQITSFTPGGARGMRIHGMSFTAIESF